MLKFMVLSFSLISPLPSPTPLVNQLTTNKLSDYILMMNLINVSSKSVNLHVNFVICQP